MKRPWLIIVAGLVLALLGYGASYLAGSAKARRMAHSQTPELAWLQTEFHVSDAELARIRTLHESYLSACAERCQRIDAKNAELQKCLAATNAVTPEIEKMLAESAQLRSDCQKAMLQHFFEISRTMPPDQSKRYFDWIVGCTFGPEHESMTRVSTGADHEHHHP